MINLTPLIDVVFVVLIMFIIIAPMTEIDRVSLAEGKPIKQHVPAQQKPIVLHVRDNNEILLNHKLVSEKELLPLFRELYLSYPTAIPQVFHDKHAFFGTYQAIKNALEQSGFETMDVILKNE